MLCLCCPSHGLKVMFNSLLTTYFHTKLCLSWRKDKIQVFKDASTPGFRPSVCKSVLIWNTGSNNCSSEKLFAVTLKSYMWNLELNIITALKGRKIFYRICIYINVQIKRATRSLSDHRYLTAFASAPPTYWFVYYNSAFLIVVVNVCKKPTFNSISSDDVETMLTQFSPKFINLFFKSGVIY